MDVATFSKDSMNMLKYFFKQLNFVASYLGISVCVITQKRV